MKRFLSIQGAGHKISGAELEEQIRYDLSVNVIELNIQLKREYRKQYNSQHILEKNLIQGGVFLSGTPHTATMNK